MRDIYLYEGTDVLKNLLDIRDRKLLEDAEADYVTFRLKEIAINPLPGYYDYDYLLRMHKYIFQDIYEWAGQQRTLNIYKEEPVLGGLSVDYSEIFDIPRDSENILSEMRNKSWNTMDTHEAAVEFSISLACTPRVIELVESLAPVEAQSCRTTWRCFSSTKATVALLNCPSGRRTFIISPGRTLSTCRK